MTALTNKFRRWYKGNTKIIRITQGDNNLIAVLFRTPNTNNYSVGRYIYRKNADGKLTFNLVELEEGMTKQEGSREYNNAVREF